MSVIKHRQMDICTDVFRDEYEEYYVERGAIVNELHIRYDNDFQGMAWLYNEQPQRILIFCPSRQVIINLYDPFRAGYRIR